MKNRTPNAPPDVPAFTPVPRKYRQDGWTPERQQAFIDALAATGSVKRAAHQINMSSEGAYALRQQPGAEEFRAAWHAALDHGVQMLEDIALERAIHGVEVPVYSYGKLIGSRIVHNDRLLMFILRNRSPDRFAGGATAKRLTAKAEADLRAKWESESSGMPEDPEEQAAYQAKLVARFREALRMVKSQHPPEETNPPLPPW